MNKYDPNKFVESVDPPTKYLTFGCWIYLVPQYEPQSVLILGFAGGTVAGLIRLLYGNVPIYAVDIEPCGPKYGVNFIQANAKEFVKTCGHFDTVIVDLFIKGATKVPDFVTKEEFVNDLTKIANYIIVNTMGEPDMSSYRHLKQIAAFKPPRLINKIYYFEINKIPNLYL